MLEIIFFFLIDVDGATHEEWSWKGGRIIPQSTIKLWVGLRRATDLEVTSGGEGFVGVSCWRKERRT